MHTNNVILNKNVLLHFNILIFYFEKPTLHLENIIVAIMWDDFQNM